MTSEQLSSLSSSLLTNKEACALLKIGMTRLYELINGGHLEAIKLGPRCTRIKAESIEKLLTRGIA